MHRRRNGGGRMSSRKPSGYMWCFHESPEVDVETPRQGFGVLVEGDDVSLPVSVLRRGYTSAGGTQVRCDMKNVYHP